MDRVVAHHLLWIERGVWIQQGVRRDPQRGDPRAAALPEEPPRRQVGAADVRAAHGKVDAAGWEPDARGAGPEALRGIPGGHARIAEQQGAARGRRDRVGHLLFRQEMMRSRARHGDVQQADQGSAQAQRHRQVSQSRSRHR
jgi:hypothetical protein